jgi:hypothetical protein
MEPETDLEKERYAAALRRKELSLILSGRMKPSESIELKKLFKKILTNFFKIRRITVRIHIETGICRFYYLLLMILNIHPFF